MSTAGISVTFLIAVDSSRIPFFVTSWYCAHNDLTADYFLSTATGGEIDSARVLLVRHNYLLDSLSGAAMCARFRFTNPISCSCFIRATLVSFFFLVLIVAQWNRR